MFDHPEEKLKKAAKVLFVISIFFDIALGIGGGIFLQEVTRTYAMVFVGLIAGAVLIAFSWVACLFIYSFGEILSNQKKIENNQMAERNNKSADASAPDSNKSEDPFSVFF